MISAGMYAERREMHASLHDRSEYCAQFRLSLLKRTCGRPRYYPRPFDNVKLSSTYRYSVRQRHASNGNAERVGDGLPGNIQSIERAAAILRLLSGRSRRLGVVDLAGELGLPKGTVHGLLRTLQHVGFVEQDPETGKYQLGAALLHMGSSYLDGNELRTRALNWSDSLAARTQEAVRIGTLHEGQVLIVHHVFRPDDSLQTLDVGSLLPAHATALGKILLAHHPYVAAEVAKNGLDRVHRRHDLRPRAAGARARSASASAVGRPTSASCARCRCRWRRRSWTGAASRWARWVSSVHRSGC